MGTGLTSGFPVPALSDPGGGDTGAVPAASQALSVRVGRSLVSVSCIFQLRDKPQR
jgi:hypothetical protein